MSKLLTNCAGDKLLVNCASTKILTSCGCPTITLDNTLGTVSVCMNFTGQITASGGRAPYTYQVVSGSLPTGLSLNSDGTISGKPTVAGTFSPTIRATDSDNCTGDRQYSLTAIGACEYLCDCDKSAIPEVVHTRLWWTYIDPMAGTITTSEEVDTVYDVGNHCIAVGTWFGIERKVDRWYGHGTYIWYGPIQDYICKFVACEFAGPTGCSPLGDYSIIGSLPSWVISAGFTVS